MARRRRRTTGERAALANTRRMRELAESEALLPAVLAGAMPLQNDVKRRVYRWTPPRSGNPSSWRTGTYRRSIHTETISRNPPIVAVGTNQPQARRLEYGFRGTDSLGRRYNDPPRPHWRPAADSTTTRNAMLKAFSLVAAAIIAREAAKLRT